MSRPRAARACTAGRSRARRGGGHARRARYLGPGATLLHGDFFPGSWLHDDSAPWIIDPEFGFYGPPEFDVGVLLAHLNLAGQDDALSEHVWEAYAAPGGFDRSLAQGFAGIEIIRRLLGVS